MKTYSFVLLSTFLLLNCVRALYSKSDDVVELTSSNFQKKIGKSSGVWYVDIHRHLCTINVEFMCFILRCAGLWSSTRRMFCCCYPVEES